MYITTTGTVVAQLTRLGRQILADNSANFQITRYKFSDDGIDYSLFDGSAVDAPNASILSTPVLEADTVGGIPSQRYTLFTAPTNFIQVSWIDTDIEFPFVDGRQEERIKKDRFGLAVNTDKYNQSNPYTFKVRTYYGKDSTYLVTHTDLLEGQLALPLVGPGGNIVVLPYHQVTGVPCTDPYVVDQQQSEGTILFYPNIGNASYVTAALNADRFSFLISQGDVTQAALATHFSNQTAFLTEWAQYYVDRINAAVVAQGSTPLSPADAFQYVDQYGETGIATGRLTIRGVNTGELVTVDVFLYSPTILRGIFKGFGGK